MKDGGDESSVTGYWLIEIKSLFSIVLLRFEGKSRNAFHEHAFNSINWLFDGVLKETHLLRVQTNFYKPSWKPFIIRRYDFHKIDSIGYDDPAWVLSFRGPWAKTWKEFLPNTGKYKTLTHGRVEVHGT